MTMSKEFAGSPGYGANEEGQALTGSAGEMRSQGPSIGGGLNAEAMKYQIWNNKVMFTISLLCFLDSMYSLCVVAFIPELMVTESPYHAAFVFTLYYAANLAGNRCTTFISRLLGRDNMLTFGVACLFSSAALSVMAVNGSVHLRMILLARTMQGFGSAVIQAAALGMVLDECARADEATTEDAFASVVTANAFGEALGPCIGGILFTCGGGTVVFLAFVILVGLAGILCSFYVSFPEGSLPIVSYEGLLQDPSTVITAMGFSLVYACMSLLWATFPIHLDNVFASKEAVVGLIFTLVLLSHDIFLPIIYSFLEVRSAENRNTFVACAFGMIGTFIVLAYMAKRWYGMCAMLFMFAFSAALGMGCCSTELSERSTQNLANYHLKENAVLVGAAVGPFIGALVSQENPDNKSQQDLFVGYCMCAALCFGYVPLYYKIVYQTPPKDV